MRNACRAPFTSFCKAVGYLLFSPLWAIVIHFYRYLVKDAELSPETSVFGYPF